MRCEVGLVALTIASAVALTIASSGSLPAIGHEGATHTIMRDDEHIADQTALEETNSLCADKWSSDLEMQNHCYEANVSARKRAQSYALTNGSVETMIWKICAARWTDQKHRIDWEMMEDCLDEQVGALQVAQRRRRR